MVDGWVVIWVVGRMTGGDGGWAIRVGMVSRFMEEAGRAGRWHAVDSKRAAPSGRDAEEGRRPMVCPSLLPRLLLPPYSLLSQSDNVLVHERWWGC